MMSSPPVDGDEDSFDDVDQERLGDDDGRLCVEENDEEETDSFDENTKLSPLSLVQEDGLSWITTSCGGLITFASSEAATRVYKGDVECGYVINCQNDKAPASAVSAAALTLSQESDADNLIKQLGLVCSRITDTLQSKERVLVHCTTGRAVSPSVVLLVLMLCDGVTYMEAHKWVKSVSKSADILASVSTRSSKNIVNALTSV
jgi:hypothetical protein